MLLQELMEMEPSVAKYQIRINGKKVEGAFDMAGLQKMIKSWIGNETLENEDEGKKYTIAGIIKDSGIGHETVVTNDGMLEMGDDDASITISPIKAKKLK